MIESLPPISATTRLIHFCPRCGLAANSLMRKPTSLEPVNEMKRISGCVRSRSPISLPEPGNEVHDAGRYADLVQQIDEPRGDDGRIARRFEHDRVAGDDRGRRHADHDRAGEVPRRDHRADAQRDVDELVAFALERHDRLRPRVAQRLARVELEEVDRLGDIAVGFGPALADFVDQQRVVIEAPLAQQLRRSEEILRALGQRQMLPGFERARRRLDRLARLLGVCRRDACR